MSDQFESQTIDLSASFVQLIRTALNNPKVTLDKTGLKSYDANGNLVAAINADGTASFQGSVSALGVSLPASIVGQSPGTVNSVRWTRQADGAVVASMVGEGPRLVNDPVPRTQLVLQAESPDHPNNNAAIVLAGNHVGGAGGQNFVQASVGSHSLNVLDDAAASDLLQKANNLSDVANVATTRKNLGFSSPATAFRNAAAAFTAGQWVAIPVNAYPNSQATDDPDGLFSLANGWYVVPTTGRYLVSGQFEFNIGAGASVFAGILLNGTRVKIGDGIGSGSDVALTVTGIIQANLGDHIQLGAFLSAGAGATVAGTPNGNNYLDVVRVM